jgi:hypothetical protein
MRHLYEFLGAATLFVSFFAMVVSIIATKYAYDQVVEARQERVSAEAAAKRAEFLATILQADNGQREAFEKLEGIMNDSNSKDQHEATTSYLGIVQKYRMVTLRLILDRSDLKGADPDSLSINELLELFQTPNAADELRIGIVGHVGERRTFTPRQKLDFLQIVLRTDQNLFVLKEACAYFGEIANIKISTLGYKACLDWYDAHKNEPR